MDYCGPQRVPHSFFLGGPFRWTALDRAKALAWFLQDRAKCPNCGTRAEEWDPDLGGHDHAYLPDVRKCWGCAEKSKAEKKVDEKRDGAGVWVALTKNPEAVT